MSDNVSALAKELKDSCKTQDGIQAQTLTLLRKFLERQTRGPGVESTMIRPKT